MAKGGYERDSWREDSNVWPAEWRVFLYWGGGLPREAIRRGRRSMRSQAALCCPRLDGRFKEGEDEVFVLLQGFVILSA